MTVESVISGAGSFELVGFESWAGEFFLFDSFLLFEPYGAHCLLPMYVMGLLNYLFSAHPVGQL